MAHGDGPHMAFSSIHDTVSLRVSHALVATLWVTAGALCVVDAFQDRRTAWLVAGGFLALVAATATIVCACRHMTLRVLALQARVALEREDKVTRI